MIENNLNLNNNANLSAQEWGPKGHYHIPMHKAFPLDDDETSARNIVNTGFTASYSEDKGDVIEAVKSLDPYLHPKNQILLKALIKVNSLVHDVNTLLKVSSDVSINDIQVKPLTIKEGLYIAQEMSPYLSPKVKYQVENVSTKLHTIDQLKKDIYKVKTAETTEIKIEYILENLRHFIPREKYNQIKQVVNIVKIFQTSSALSEIKNEENEDIEATPVDTQQQENDQLSDIMNMLDTFSSKKNTE